MKHGQHAKYAGGASVDAAQRHARRGPGSWKVQLLSNKQQTKASIGGPWSRLVSTDSEQSKPDPPVKGGTSFASRRQHSRCRCRCRMLPMLNNCGCALPRKLRRILPLAVDLRLPIQSAPGSRNSFLRQGILVGQKAEEGPHVDGLVDDGRPSQAPPAHNEAQLSITSCKHTGSHRQLHRVQLYACMHKQNRCLQKHAIGPLSWCKADVMQMPRAAGKAVLRAVAGCSSLVLAV